MFLSSGSPLVLSVPILSINIGSTPLPESIYTGTAVITSRLVEDSRVVDEVIVTDDEDFPGSDVGEGRELVILNDLVFWAVATAKRRVIIFIVLMLNYCSLLISFST